MRHVNEIIIHCADTRPEWMAGQPTKAKVSEIRRWHVEGRGWSDIGYHYVIDRDGTVVEGRPVERTGAHVKGHNANSIGICLIGGHGGASTDAFLDNFTQDQDEAIRELVFKLRMQFPSIDKTTGHNQYAAKACPCFSVPAWLSSARTPDLKPLVKGKERTSAAQSSTVRASAVQVATGVGGAVAALQGLSGTAQLVAIGGAVLVVLLAIWIMKERLRYWAAGLR